MPFYEYVCDDCNTQFELKRTISAIDAPTACPQCHGDHVARQISRVMAFSHGDNGAVSSLGGNSCGGGNCGGGGSCGSCASHN